MPSPLKNSYNVESKPLGYSLGVVEPNVSSIQIITEDRNNREPVPSESNDVTSICTPDDTMYSGLLTGLYYSTVHYVMCLGSNI